MELSQQSSRIAPPAGIRRIMGRLRLTDPKADIFLGANVMDAALTSIALQYGTELTEFNSIIYTIMNTVGIGTAMFFKVVLCVGILWLLRRFKKEKLLVPLSIVLVLVALGNLMVIRLHGVEV